MAEPIVNTLGIVGMKHCGDYSNSTNYEKLNVVTYQGSSYCAKGNTVGNLPTNTTYWDLLAEKGSKGDEGPQGQKPVKGVDYYTAQDIADLEDFIASDVTDEVSAQLDDLVSATPLAAETIADMTDTTRIYVLTTDGHWYWYDGDSWEDGGAYQTAEDSDTLTNVVGEVQKITNKLQLVTSKNLWDPNNQKNGFIAANGVEDLTSTSYFHLKDPIPVNVGDVVTFYGLQTNQVFAAGTARFICAYDENKDVMSSAGASAAVESYTVPEGVAYINPTLGSNYAKRMVITNATTAPTAFIEYFAPYYKAGDGFHDNIDMEDTNFDDIYLDYSNVNRLDPNACLLNKFLDMNGNITDNSNYFVTDYMPIHSGETLYGFIKSSLSRFNIRAYCVYDANLGVLGGSNVEVSSIPYIENAAYVRASIIYNSSSSTSAPSNKMIVATSTPVGAVDYGNDPVFKSKYIPPASESDNLHVYLPKEIPVGIGRTVELYNELICLEANKYHMRWSCSTGVAFKKKFSITGATAGNYTLTLQIFNDNMEMVWSGSSTVKVVNNVISDEIKVLPIGDSLTNVKPWLSEVISLSSNKIKYIGTRGRSDSTIGHEGRSGFSALNYLQNSSYTFDNNYKGNPNVSGSVNPFWDTLNSRFSLDYYNSQQATTVGTADVVQLFLGTNDVFGAATPQQAAGYIKSLVDEIRTDDENIPIFVCNTIYRSNQNGYYTSGGQGFSSAGGWAYDSDMKIMNLQNALAEALDDYENVYIVPLSVCMDRENDFGQVEVPVNPRLASVTEIIPSESVHPQNAGYMQIADVIYSSYIAHLS